MAQDGAQMAQFSGSGGHDHRDTDGNNRSDYAGNYVSGPRWTTAKDFSEVHM